MAADYSDLHFHLILLLPDQLSWHTSPAWEFLSLAIPIIEILNA
jgi:hypothetical protein